MFNNIGNYTLDDLIQYSHTVDSSKGNVTMTVALGIGVTGRGEDNEAGVFFEHLVDTVDDPSIAHG